MHLINIAPRLQTYLHVPVKGSELGSNGGVGMVGALGVPGIIMGVVGGETVTGVGGVPPEVGGLE